MAAVLKNFPSIIASARAYGTPRLQRFLEYARVELTPPTGSDIPAIQNSVGQIYQRVATGQWKEMTMKEVGRNGLVGLDIFLFFFVGTCIGKGSIQGYRV